MTIAERAWNPVCGLGGVDRSGRTVLVPRLLDVPWFEWLPSDGLRWSLMTEAIRQLNPHRPVQWPLPNVHIGVFRCCLGGGGRDDEP